MTTEPNPGVPRSFVTQKLPWLIGAGALLVYLLTLNHWVSLNSLALVARVSGWDWQPAVSQPLTLAVLYPFRWLPGAWAPVALNLFSAVCASLVLVLLARSVALLPHEVARDDPFRPGSGVAILSTPTAWVPPVLAAILCGLQLTFWEHATSVSNAMIDLLLFAYVIRCLLEYRVDGEERWLGKCALVYGAGMANDWAMVGYFPIFLAALVWVTGFGVIYNRRLLRRTLLWGLAGLSVFLWLPVIQGLSPDSPVGLWGALKANLQLQKQGLIFVRRPAFQVLALVSLLPVIVLSIRWRSHTVRYGDDTRLAVLLTKVTVRFAHALFFIAALWLGLDATFSPRHLDLGPPMLTYYYLSAMMAGYCAGYFLQLASSTAAAEPDKPVGRPALSPMGDPLAAERRLGRLAGASVWVVLGLLPVVLLWKNLGQIRFTNGPVVREFSRELWEDLPDGKSVVLSEDRRQLILLLAELPTHPPGKEPLPLNTRALRTVAYQRFTANQFPSRWPLALPTNEVIRLGGMLKLVSAFAAHDRVMYAHPSSGLFFERFADQPNGLMHRLVRRGAEDTPNPALTPQVVAENEQLWQRRWAGPLKTLAGETAQKPRLGPEWAWPLLNTLQLQAEPNQTAADLGVVYSKSLNYWGVQLQRMDQWSEAGVWFERALALNPANVSAHINARYNQQCQRGDKSRLESAAVEKEFRVLLESYRNWAQILDSDGPVDEPTFLLRVGQVFLSSGDYRQATREFARCAQLAPDWAEPKLWQALSCVGERRFTAALALTDALQTSQPLPGPAPPAQILLCQTAALRGLGRTNEADACLERFLRQYNDRNEVLATAADLLEQNRQFKAELPVLDVLLSRKEGSSDLLARKGWCELQLASFEAAVASLSRALSHDAANTDARLHRAIANLAAGNLQPAREDFQELLKTEAYAQNARFGLAAIARREHDTNAAIEFYEAYLTNSIPESREFQAAERRLRALGLESGLPKE